MILNEQAYKTKTNVEVTSNFQIQSSSKAFKILSSNLYKDKIAAVIRELSTNGLDAHIASKNPDPISVHLPTYKNPTFVVTDEGVGMTEEEVHKLYTTYFGSSKSDSNDYVGALGLGSKSPFAYTDSFTVESSKDGIKNVFSCFLNESATPVLSKVISTECDKSGTTISVPVNENDISSFENKAVEIYKYFDIVPLINIERVAQRVKEFKEADTILSGESYSILNQSANSDISIVMGNTCYPVSVDQCGSILRNVPIIKLIKNTYRRSMYVRVPIGTADIAPSREELSYDKLTISNLFEIFNNISNEVELDFEKKINGLETVKDIIIYKNDNRAMLETFSTNPNLTLDHLLDDHKNILGMTLFTVGSRQSRNSYRTDYLKSVRSMYDWSPVSFYKGTTFLSMTLKDLGKRGRKNSVLQYMENKNHKRLVVLEPGSEQKNIIIKNGVKFITVEDLPEIAKIEYAKRKPAIRLDYITAFNCEKDRVENVLDCKKTTYYIVANNNKVKILNRTYNVFDSEFTQVMRFIEARIVVISKGDWRKKEGRINKDKNLKELTDVNFKKLSTRKIKKTTKGNEEFIARIVFSGNTYYSSFESFFNTDFSWSELMKLKQAVENELEKDKLEELKKFNMFKIIYSILMIKDEWGKTTGNDLAYTIDIMLTFNSFKEKYKELLVDYKDKAAKDLAEIQDTINKINNNSIYLGLIRNFNNASRYQSDDKKKEEVQKLYNSFVNF